MLYAPQKPYPHPPFFDYSQDFQGLSFSFYQDLVLCQSCKYDLQAEFDGFDKA